MWAERHRRWLGAQSLVRPGRFPLDNQSQANCGLTDACHIPAKPSRFQAFFGNRLLFSTPPRSPAAIRWNCSGAVGFRSVEQLVQSPDQTQSDCSTWAVVRNLEVQQRPKTAKHMGSGSKPQSPIGPPVPNASRSRVARGKQADLSRRSTWKTPKSARHRHAAWSNPAGGTASENRSRARRRADSHCSRSAVAREWSLVEPRVETEVGIGEPSAQPNSRRPPRGAKMCGASPQRKTVTGVHTDGIPSEVPDFTLVRRAVRTKSMTFQRNATSEIRIHEGRKGTLLRPSFGPVPRQLG